ncbi:Ku protein [Bdellovibrio sp. KM01]|uniref:non-homologous end joining protein Ku n=1 Tax=Bdellovibrio sp. KM01 TaxID=2748865 RepID=UPI0015E9D8D8|nr:Ku protein [Bdellovibrio sp. KM01]QLY26247.1 Ku protein [Bdellovibrio sp. KM01]
MASIWKGSISFGLLNIPVTLQGAQSEKEISFSMLDKKDLSRIQYKKINAKTGKEVPYENIVKGYEYTSGRYVLVTEDEIRKSNVKASQTIDIEDIVSLEEIDPMYFERPYYLVPQKGAEKGYYLLRDALAKSGRVAVSKIVIRIKQHLAMIMPKGEYLMLELLRFGHEVKTEKQVHYMKDVTKTANYNPRELKMAEDLIEGMTSKWKPEQYKDTYYQEVMKVIDRKIKGGKGHKVAPIKEEDVETTDNVVDLMPLLQKSLAARKTAKKKAPSKSRARSKPA